MERTPHVMLVGEGARLFAVQQVSAAMPEHPDSLREWEKTGPSRSSSPTSAGPDQAAGAAAVQSRHRRGAGAGQQGFAGGVCSTSGLATSCPAASAIRDHRGGLVRR